MSENEILTQEEIASRITRLNTSTNALEDMLCAVIEHLPARKRKVVLGSFKGSAQSADGFLLFDDYSDEEAEASKEANQRPLRLLSVAKKARKAM